MLFGTVKTFFEDRGFGFIARDDGAPDLFVHANNIANASVISNGQKVSFQAEISSRSGKLQAVNVHVVAQRA